jgi:hypothetical protein
MCPHTATFVSSYGYICVLILQVVEQTDIEGAVAAAGKRFSNPKP